MRDRSPVKILVAVGTRPEAIKMAPLIRLLRPDRRFRIRLCSTGQHQELLPSALGALGLKPDIQLKHLSAGNSPAALLKKLVPAVEKVLRRRRPDLVLVQGDTTSALAAALAARGLGIPVGHVEAGLRTFDLKNPFPEERNRVRIDALSSLLFAPTRAAKANLLREDLESDRIFVTGNTGIDSLLWAIRQPGRLKPDPKAKFAVVTLHRRESFGRPLERILLRLIEAADGIPDITWIFPVHLNPRVREAAGRLPVHPRIKLTKPLNYPDFVQLMKRARFLVTDSGGIQEEAPTLRKRVLVVRAKTERPELLRCGAGRLIGVSPGALLKQARRLARAGAGPSSSKNPFGDGRASRRILRAILYWAGRIRARPADWAG